MRNEYIYSKPYCGFNGEEYRDVIARVKVILEMELLFFLMLVSLLVSISLSVWLFLAGEWFRVWLRGSCAVFFLFAALFITVFSFELLRLDVIKMDGPMGSVSLKQKGEKQGEIVFATLKQQQAIPVANFQSTWVVVVDAFSIVDLVKSGQSPTFFKLRYVKVGDTETLVGGEPLFFDAFKVVSIFENSLPIFDLHQYTSEPVSFVDKAEFTLIKRGDRLVAWPSNHHAQKAVPAIQNTQK